MNDNWNQQQADMNSSAASAGSQPPGTLLRGYRQQRTQNQINQQSPASMPTSQGYNPYSPMPPISSQQQPPQPQQWSPPSQPLSPPSQSLQQWSPQLPQQPFPPQPQQWSPQQPQQPGFAANIANTMQMVRSWSGKMVAIYNGRQMQPPAPEPMVLYHPAQARPMTEPLHNTPRPKRWKRSRAVRVSIRMRHRRARWQDKKPKGKIIGLSIVISLLLLIVSLISSGAAYAYGYYQSQLPRLQGLASQQITQTTHIYDRNGVLLKDLYDTSAGSGGRRTYVVYKYIPQIMQDAMVAAEDHTFWTNSGVDPQGILRAATQYSQAGSVQSGGSTITQQLIKNLTGDTQVSLNRKLPEAALAIGLTQQYPKQKILEMYLNIAPFGSQDLGIEAASEEYFHLKPNCDTRFSQGIFNCIPGAFSLDVNAAGKKDPILGLARASLLAGMPQSPGEYDPTLGKPFKLRALARQDEILHEMLSLNMSTDGVLITESVIQQAETLTKNMTFTRYSQNVKAPHFVQWIVQQLEVALGHGDTNAGATVLLNGGFNIRTTIDSRLESYVETAVKRHLTQPEQQFFTSSVGPLNVVNNVNDAAVVVMSAKTGEILAMDGSSDYNNTGNPAVDGQFNAAADAYRQPGSTWKPIVYSTAFEQGWYPGMVLPDVKTYFPNGGGVNATAGYVPPDYGGQYVGGNNTIRIATANSRNVPAVKAMMFAGIDNVANMAKRMGITNLGHDLPLINKASGSKYTSVTQVGPSVALGTMGVPLVQMVGAYQVFANNGMRVPPQGIMDIWDNYGHHLYHYDYTHPHGVQVISPQIAFLMTSVLSDEYSRAAEFWPDHQLSFWDTYTNYAPASDPTYPDVAAKTGTTDNFVDNWTIGYTADVVVGVWAGNANNTPMQNVIGITGAAPIWHSVMERASNMCSGNIPEPFGDGIPCDSAKFPSGEPLFGLHKFVPPPGVVQIPVSSSDGLKGYGVTDWMLDGEQPIQNGVSQGSVCTPAPGTTTCTTGVTGSTGPIIGNGTPTP